MPGIEDLQNKMSEKSLIDFLNSDPEQVAFGKSVSNESQRQFDYLTDILKRTESSEEKIQLLNQIKDNFGRDILMNIASGNVVGKDFSNLDREIASKLYIGVSPEDILRPKYGDMIEGRTISDIDRGGRTMSNMDRQMIKGYAEGDEVSMMMMELEGDEDGMQEEAMKELEAARPEFEMMQQLAQVVINLIEQGASEAEIVAILKEQGLDDEDIQTLLEFVNEMMGQAEQGGMAEDDIGSQLQGMM